jgi:hypothetical protein
MTGMKQFVFGSPQKTNCFKISKKTKRKVSRKHSHTKQVLHDKNSNYQRTMWMPESW